MDYYLFLDESGDHGLTRIDPQFPIFVLCGVLISQADYEDIKSRVRDLKSKFWNNKKVILHSRDIRKCDKEFSILLDDGIKKSFYNDLNKIIKNTSYEIISSAIDKNKYLKRYGLLTDNVYQISLSFILERSIFCLDSKATDNKRLIIGIEKRGKKRTMNCEVIFKNYFRLELILSHEIESAHIKPPFILGKKKRILLDCRLQTLLHIQLHDIFWIKKEQILLLN